MQGKTDDGWDLFQNCGRGLPSQEYPALGQEKCCTHSDNRITAIELLVLYRGYLQPG